MQSISRQGLAKAITSRKIRTQCKFVLLCTVLALVMFYFSTGLFEMITAVLQEHKRILINTAIGITVMRRPALAIPILPLLNLPTVLAMQSDIINEFDDAAIKSWILLTVNVGTGLKDKLAYLMKYSRAKRADFIVVSETGFIRKDITSKEYYSKGFDKDYVAYHVAPVRYGRKHKDETKERRGISIIVHRRWENYITESDIEYNLSLNLIRIPVVKENIQTQIIGVYAEPQEGYREEYWKKFELWFSKLERSNDRLIVIGDLNAPLNPRLDKSNPNEARTETYEGLREVMQDDRLLDAWRLKHGRKRVYTWSSNLKDPNAPATRIDHALISPALQTKLIRCDILASHKPLNTDHVPICLEIERPANLQDVSNIDRAPEITLEAIDVARLKEVEQREAYTKQFSIEKVTEILSQNDPTLRYNKLKELILQSGKSALGTKMRTLNAEPRPLKRTVLERLTSYCHSILLSRHLLRKAISDKLPFPMTRNITKLLKLIPQEYTLMNPESINTPEQTEEWLMDLSKLSCKLNEEMLSNWKDKKAERIIENCERATNRETSDTRGFFARASGLLYKTVRRARQLVVDLEIPPQELGKPMRVDNPEDVKKETSRFWETVFRKRHINVNVNTPWISEKFKARRSNLVGAEKLLEPISKDELMTTVRKIKSKKAFGMDNMPGELLKELPNNAISALLAVLEDIRVHPEHVPEDWKLSRIFLIHKSGDVNRCSNYRPISITSVVYKIYMKIQTERLTKYVEDNKLLSEVQGGFRKKRSTMDKVAQLAAIFAARIRQGQANHTIFVDFKNAYDSVPHEQLFELLRLHGIPNEYVEGIRALYTNTKASVITAYGDAEPFLITRGVKQGCPMSPLLFNLFIEPLLEWLQDEGGHDNHVLAFADDVALNAPIETDLQISMNRIEAYCHHHAMEIGIAKNKTAYMSSSPRNCDIYYRPLEESVDQNGRLTLKPASTRIKLAKLTGIETYKYLGVYINAGLDWTEHYDRVEARLRQHLHFLYNSCYTHRQIIRIVNVLIIPYATYGMEVIVPNSTRMDRFDRMLEKLVNAKGGVLYNAKREYNRLNPEYLGQGQQSLSDKVVRLQHEGKLRHGLNSPDKLTETITREEWNSPHSAYNKQRFEANNPSKLKIVNLTAPHALSLECIFEDNDPNMGTLRNVYRINDTNELITPEGNLVPIAAQNETIRKHLCLGDTTRIKPIYLFRVKPILAIQGMQHDTVNIELPVTIFTDGSEKDGKTGFALYIAQGHRLNHAEAEKRGTKNFKAEMHAAICALLIHDPYRSFRLITDNLSVCNVLNAPLTAIATHPDEAEWLTAAHEVLELRRILQKETRIIHVYSHLNKGDESEKMKKKFRLMTEKFGDELNQVIAGNEAADQLAKVATCKPFHRIRVINQYMNAYQAVGQESGETVFNVTEFLQSERQQHYLAVLGKQMYNGEPRYDFLARKGIDWHRSAYLGKNTTRVANSIQKHAHRCRRQMLSDKESRFKRKDLPFWTQKRYKNIVVEDPYCDLCRHIGPHPIVENRTHYLHCKASELERAMIKTRVLYAINQRLKQPVRDVPCYWNDQDKHMYQVNDLWKSIEKYSVEDAARALIPRAWVTYLRSLNWTNDDDFELAVAECQYLITEGLFACWKARCKHFYRTHKPRPKPINPT